MNYKLINTLIRIVYQFLGFSNYFSTIREQYVFWNRNSFSCWGKMYKMYKCLKRHINILYTVRRAQPLRP